MGKFINIPLPIVNEAVNLPAKVVVTNSETTTASAAGKLTDTGGTPNFTANVMVGDIIFGQAYTSQEYCVVDSIDSDSVLSISGPGTSVLETSGKGYYIFTSESAHTIVLPTGLFLTDVNAGDFIINEAENISGNVAKVISNTELLLDRIMYVDNGETATVISRSGYGGRLVSLENIASISNGDGASDEPIEITYKTTGGASALLITTNTNQVGFQWSTAFTEKMIEVLESNWKDVVVEMPLISTTNKEVMYASTVGLS